MTKDALQVSTDPDPFEPFLISQAFKLDNLVITSGQAAIDRGGNIVGIGDFDAQAEQTFINLKDVLESAGSSLEQVIKVTIYLTDMSNFPKIMALREQWFTKPYPADTIVEVKSLALGELEIEIEAMALIEGDTISP